MPAIYFSLSHVQPFADIEAETLEPGIDVVRGDGKVVGLRLEQPQMVLRLPEIAERLGIDATRLWDRLRGDADVLIRQRAPTWGGGGNR